MPARQSRCRSRIWFSGAFPEREGEREKKAPLFAAVSHFNTVQIHEALQSFRCFDLRSGSDSACKIELTVQLELHVESNNAGLEMKFRLL